MSCPLFMVGVVEVERSMVLGAGVTRYNDGGVVITDLASVKRMLRALPR